MKKLFLLPLVLFFISCDESHKVGPEDSLPDSNASASSTPKLDETPRPVRNGKTADYAYYPDTSMYDLVLGSAASFKKFKSDNGFRGYDEKNGCRGIALYNTYQKVEWLLLLTTKNAKGEPVVYGCTLQKFVKGAPNPPPANPVELSKQHVVTGHNIYIGMTPEYLLSIYRDQEFMQWQKGDTLYMQYKPKAKDAPYFKRFSYSSYTATYKFVDDHLRRIEYYVDPADLEARK